MEATSAARAAYWTKKIEDYIVNGKPIPKRFGKALTRQTFISQDITVKGAAHYIPDRSPAAIEALTEMYRPFPKALSAILAVKEPIPIKPITRKRRKTGKTSSGGENYLVDFREPKYAPAIAKLIELGRPVMLVGPAGSGKSRLFFDIAEKAGKKIYRVNFDGGMTPDAFLGGVRFRTVKNADGTTIQETYFMEGPVIKAAAEGAWLLLDEIDKLQPEHAASLHAMLENIHNPIVINDDGGRIVTPHPDFRVFSTANSLGALEDSSLGYYASSPMDAAFRDRWAILQVDYPPDEPAIINDILKNKEMSGKLVKVAKLARQAMADGKLNGTPFSTRRLIAWASTFKYLGDFEYAAELEVLGRYAAAPRSLIESFISNIFGNTWRSSAPAEQEAATAS